MIAAATITSITYAVTVAVYGRDLPIPANYPLVVGGFPANYTVSPALPAGIVLDTATGVISGTPTATAVSANYVVTGTNSANALAASALNITVVGTHCALDGIRHTYTHRHTHTHTYTHTHVSADVFTIRVFVQDSPRSPAPRPTRCSS